VGVVVLLLIPTGIPQADLIIESQEIMRLFDGELLQLDGDLRIAENGHLTGASDSQIRVAGDWNNRGHYTHGDGHIYFVGLDESKITGQSTFHTLIADLKEVDTTGGKTLRFESEVTQTITHFLQLRGDDKSDLMIRSTQDGVNAILDVSDAEIDLTKTDIKDVDLGILFSQQQALLEILEDSLSVGGKNNLDGEPVTLAQLELVATDIQSELLGHYQSRIAQESKFSNPPLIAEVQFIIDGINRIAKESLQNIFNHSGSRAPESFILPSLDGITLAQLQAVANHVNPKLLAEYQAAIADYKDFDDPPTIAQVQALIDDVNNLYRGQALAEVLEDSASPNGQNNINGIPVSLAQLQLINKDIHTTLLTQYQVAIRKEQGFSNLPTDEQVQDVINHVNDTARTNVLLALLAPGNIVSLEQLQIIAIHVNPYLLELYQEAIENKTDFSNPPTVEQVQALIDQVNTFAHKQALDEIYEDSAGGANNANGKLVGLVQLHAISGLKNIQSLLFDLYQLAIQEKADFSNPVLVAEVQALINKVNRDSTLALMEVLEDSSSSGGAQNADANPVNYKQLQQVGLVYIFQDLLSAYQKAIADEKNFHNPPLPLQVRALVNKVNRENGRVLEVKSPINSHGVNITDLAIIDDVIRLKDLLSKISCGLLETDSAKLIVNYGKCVDKSPTDLVSISAGNPDLGDRNGILQVDGDTYIFIDINGDEQPDIVWNPNQDTLEEVNLAFISHDNKPFDKVKVSGYPLGHINSLSMNVSRPQFLVGGAAGHRFRLWGHSGGKFAPLTEYITLPFSGQKELTADHYIAPLDLGNNMVILKGSSSLPIPLVVPKDIRINKWANRKQVSVGSTLVYNITLENISSITQKDMGITDKLPPGFHYVNGSARYDGAVITPVKIGGSGLHFNVGDLQQGASHLLQYQLAVGSGVNFGTYTNTAVAVATMASEDRSDDIPLSTKAKASVKVVPSALFDLATVIGKVYHDRNGDGQQTRGEEPIPNARLLTSAGQLIQVDQDGQYHLPNVIPGRMVIRLDETSLPVGASVVGHLSKLVDIRPGIPSKVNFGVQLPENSDGITPNTMVIRQLSDKPSPRLNLEIFGHAIVNPSSQLFVEPLEIYLHSNFAAFINNWTMIIREEVNGKTVKTFTGGREDLFKPIFWAGDSDNGMQTKPGQFSLQLKVTDQYDRQAITRKIPIILHAGEVDKKITNKTINVTREDILLALPYGNKTYRNDMRIKGKALYISGQGFNAININKDGNFLFTMPHLVPDMTSANDVLKQGLKAVEPVTELILPRDKYSLTAILIKQQDKLSQLKQEPILDGSNNE
jgi:uncharacterized repeat protein (TIGR01451 family)